jgi:hypothetical protein
MIVWSLYTLWHGARVKKGGGGGGGPGADVRAW